ncbi:MAG: N-6 DNA methylase, partial [Deltaproteobacteria bacterium]|nr:N-6 DNA methylase [Deltaproteobacteria bacterium]
MPVLPVEFRNKLERTIIEARDIAEAGAKAAIEAFAVHHYEPYGHMSPEQRKLRNHLRARARQLGDKQNRKGQLEITHLVRECAYEHWHRMLFARFLAENDLLIEPEMGIAVSLEECEELARDEGKDLWTLASEFAQRMLPQIFRPNDPLLKISFAREHQLKLEQLLDSLEASVFTASDSLGWVYQFWQSKRKKEVNQSGNKIGADELPAVTQLFTEPYMVSFLLDNSLGAWWAARRLSKADLQNAESEDELRNKAALPGVPLEYLRFIKLDDGTWSLAAGTFDGWPEHLSELKTLDPCCGSGHFLVAALLMLVPMRMELEGLSAQDAVDAVLRENIHGLELDQRCVELAAFALALAAWRYPDAGGFRKLPAFHIACSGLAPAVKKEVWKKLDRDSQNLRIALDWLHDQFQEAAVLGSLLDPAKSEATKIVKWTELSQMLEQALSQEQNDDTHEMGIVARGLAKATRILAGKYHWVITNVPYLARGKQVEKLKKFCERYHPAAKNDIATVFLERCLEFCQQHGVCSIVLPQNWLFLTTYRKFREKLLRNDTWHVVARLGPQAFQTPMWDFNVQLLILSRGQAVRDRLFSQGPENRPHRIRGLDASTPRTAKEKAELLLTAEIQEAGQEKQLENPDAVVVFQKLSGKILLSAYATINYGSKPGQTERVTKYFWELPLINAQKWQFLESTPSVESIFSGKEKICLSLKEIKLQEINEFGIRSADIWGKSGIVISQMREMPYSLYFGYIFDNNTSVISPKKHAYLPAILSFLESGKYLEEIREINQKLDVAAHTMVKVPFDLDYWQKVAAEKYPSGLPKPYSDDPTQWIFHGHPCGSVVWDEEKKWTARGPLRTDATVLQVAVARLLGYRWPAELDKKMELSDEQRDWVEKCNALLEYVDKDGIVCIPSVRGEEPATNRLREPLSVAFGPDWSPAREQELIKATGGNASNLDDWLRDHFFEQHCKLFCHRPFIWHIWDGRRRDGFHVLVNYHKLAAGNGKGRQLLENLTYSYLGDWITRQ